MIAAVPSLLVDLGIICGVVTAFGTATALLWKTPPVRWLRHHVSESFGEWVQGQVHEGTRGLRDDLANHREYVYYHLGPNGDAKPIHRRLVDVERAVAPNKLPFVDWHEPYDEDRQ